MTDPTDPRAAAFAHCRYRIRDPHSLLVDLGGDDLDVLVGTTLDATRRAWCDAARDGAAAGPAAAARSPQFSVLQALPLGLSWSQRPPGFPDWPVIMIDAGVFWMPVAIVDGASRLELVTALDRWRASTLSSRGVQRPRLAS